MTVAMHKCPEGIDFDVVHQHYLIDEGFRYGSEWTVVARCALVPCSKSIAFRHFRVTEDNGRILIGDV